MTQLLEDKVVVVSGIGPGLGASIARRCAAAGADIVLAARTQSRLDEVAQEVSDAGRLALPVTADVTDDAACERLVASALDRFGRVDALVNNAFVMPPMKPLGAVDVDAIRSTFETNVLAALRLTRMFAPALQEAHGSVVMINSAVLHRKAAEYGAYRMGKASLYAMAGSLAAELGPRGIRVNSVAPGWIYEAKMQWYFGHLAKQRGVTEQDVYDETAAATDLRRLPLPDEVADAVVFLASDMARAITGQCLDVNCGEYHR
jgi:NAD(P)-dependent dehydrogenase (short-subunit alcohol dehydrogenase family)